MSDDARSPKVDEVLRLSETLAEQMMGAQVLGRTIPTQQLTALVGAARFLQDHNVPWPPLVDEVVQEIGKRMAAAKSAPSDEDAAG
jgi:hypothetical protein